jgi:hypothetical protein
MSLNINLVEFEVDPLTRIEVFRRSYYDDSSLLEDIRERLSLSQVVTRLGDKIWGHSLPVPIVEQYGFIQATCLFVAMEPRFANRLLGHAVRRRFNQLGLRKVGYDKFEQPDEIAFTLGDEGELMARPRWLVRPFSLPRDDENTFTLLLNPRLAYRFEVDLEQLSDQGFDWQYFGDKVRAAHGDELSQEANPWEVGHTVRVIEERGTNRLLCEWRDGEQHEVNLAQCWPLANTTNRYRYLKRRYAGLKGKQLAEEMRAKDEEFFALKNMQRRVKNFAELIGRIEIGDRLEIELGGFVELTVMSRPEADKLQSSLLEGDFGGMGVEELADEDDEEELEEVTQLELF